jgi:hypothetical protein
MNRIFILATAALLAACSSATQENVDGDTGETGDDLSVGVTCTHANMSTSACQQMRSAVLNGAKDMDRRNALERGFAWIDANVMYSQTHSYHGYRQDCSGFVSMAWQEPTALTTAGFAPYDTSASKALSGYSQLLPADALNKHPREHIIMFGAWANAAHSQMVILEESHTGTPAMMKIVTSSYFGSFTPIRGRKFGSTNAGAGGADSSGDTAGAGDTSGSTDTSGGSTDTSGGSTDTSGSSTDTSGSGGGASCAGDGDCNPGNDGSGLICQSGQCVPGCHTNAQCPGVKTCHSGQCS